MSLNNRIWKTSIFSLLLYNPPHFHPFPLSYLLLSPPPPFLFLFSTLISTLPFIFSTLSFLFSTLNSTTPSLLFYTLLHLPFSFSFKASHTSLLNLFHILFAPSPQKKNTPKIMLHNYEIILFNSGENTHF